MLVEREGEKQKEVVEADFSVWEGCGIAGYSASEWVRNACIHGGVCGICVGEFGNDGVSRFDSYWEIKVLIFVFYLRI